MIICKWPAPPNDHLQEAGSSRSSVARGLSFQVIMCKRPVHPNKKPEGGEEGKVERERGGEEILAQGRTGGPIKGSTRGPRGPKNYTALQP